MGLVVDDDIQKTVDNVLRAIGARKDSFPRSINEVLKGLGAVVKPFNFSGVQQQMIDHKTDLDEKASLKERFERAPILAAVKKNTETNAPEIFYRQSTSAESIRFAVAHEIGHLVLHAEHINQGHLLLCSWKIDERPLTVEDYATQTQEEEAEAFAMELLVPESSFWENYIAIKKSTKDEYEFLDKMVNKYGVTFKQMEIRIDELFKREKAKTT